MYRDICDAVYSYDQIQEFSNKELSQAIVVINEKIEKARRGRGVETTTLEIEHCYLMREVQYRKRFGQWEVQPRHDRGEKRRIGKPYHGKKRQQYENQ